MSFLKELNVDALKSAVPLAKRSILEEILPILQEKCEKYQINTAKRFSAFIAQLTHESGSFTYVEEIASGKDYEYRKDLGNLEPEALEIAHKNKSTTGKFYKGRGFIQITGFYNYVSCGEGIGLDLKNNPYLLKEYTAAVESACWFWDTHNCNSLADVDDIVKITKVINGGFNGLEAREANYKRCKEVFGC